MFTFTNLEAERTTYPANVRHYKADSTRYGIDTMITRRGITEQTTSHPAAGKRRARTQHREAWRLYRMNYPKTV